MTRRVAIGTTFLFYMQWDLHLSNQLVKTDQMGF